MPLQTIEKLGENGLQEASRLVTPQLLQHLALYGPKINLPGITSKYQQSLKASPRK